MRRESDISPVGVFATLPGQRSEHGPFGQGAGAAAIDAKRDLLGEKSLPAQLKDALDLPFLVGVACAASVSATKRAILAGRSASHRGNNPRTTHWAAPPRCGVSSPGWELSDHRRQLSPS